MGRNAIFKKLQIKRKMYIPGESKVFTCFKRELLWRVKNRGKKLQRLANNSKKYFTIFEEKVLTPPPPFSILAPAVSALAYRRFVVVVSLNFMVPKTT